MLRYLSAAALILLHLGAFFQPSFGSYLLRPVVCTGVTVKLNYSTPLPASSAQTTVSTYASDRGVWHPCQLGVLRTSITYYLTLNATNANCEKATFTHFIFTGFFNCTTIFELPARAKNLTVPLSDPGKVRHLDEVQPFLGPVVVPFSVTVPLLGTIGIPSCLTDPLRASIDVPTSVTVPGFDSLYAVNFTFIFPRDKHQRGNCEQVNSEVVEIIPQLFLIKSFNSSETALTPPTVAECR